MRNILKKFLPGKVVEVLTDIPLPSLLKTDEPNSTNPDKVLCAWCNKEADVHKDGFHIVHIAIGSTQERYCFCCDECYEAFRQMYPSRVHRNCYDRSCEDCNDCIKRYSTETDGIRIVGKDRLKMTEN